jgi:hypothetical protein
LAGADPRRTALDGWADYILSDLKLLLGRLHGLEQLSWSDGTPFADEVTLTWIAEKVNDDMPGFGNEPAAVAGGEQTMTFSRWKRRRWKRVTAMARRRRLAGFRVVRVWSPPATAGYCVC